MSPREVLLVPHTGRRTNVESAARAAELLDAAGIVVRVLVYRDASSVAEHPVLGRFDLYRHSYEAALGVELVLVLGGDGTFLRAADIAHSVDVPVLGINLGHIGFLAEWEKDSLDEAIQRVIDCDYRVEDRMTVEVRVTNNEKKCLGTGWALNEVSIENV